MVEGRETTQAPPPPVRKIVPTPVAAGATRVAAWARRPAGRLIIPAIVAGLLLVAAGAAGAYLVPRSLRGEPASRATATVPPGVPAPDAPVPTAGGPSAAAGAGFPSASDAPALPGATSGRPADALAGWAQQIGTRVGIPVVAVEAYGYAELVSGRNTPGCHLSWTTLAALGEVESGHGSTGGSVLGADGLVRPPIYGLPLDGKGGRRLVRDSDQGTIDGDTTYDRAVGPMQFIPSTWRENAIDADNSGAPDPNDIDDATLTAASYLCKGGRDLAKPDVWWAAILSYNEVRPYAQRVFEAADDYGRRSRG